MKGRMISSDPNLSHDLKHHQKQGRGVQSIDSGVSMTYLPTERKVLSGGCCLRIRKESRALLQLNKHLQENCASAGRDTRKVMLPPEQLTNWLSEAARFRDP